ncbi:hypothetical protein CKO50_08560 [Pseudoalteromonas sp. HM-SA03]|uniref:hypothetical protein n=1 Tax=Pseudoalteromonas sp. HM-SA03 TaxID=2029678 RepID=UPI000BADE91E|nr:hypothetical protein [Pseudoalteromonas sp. HM-SA03]PAY01792.1 hypothetical protein CKO50_08560 [Pseudoalteromonas sp. HM-SA03]
MVKITGTLFAISSLLFVSGCGGGSDSNDPIPDPIKPPPDPVIVEPDPSVFMDVIEQQGKQYVSDAIEVIISQDINCTDTTATHEMCDIVNVKFNDGVFDQSRTKSSQTLLVLDYGMDFHTALRYRSRVKAAFKYDPQSKTFIADNPEVNLSKLGVKLLTEVNQFTFTDEKFDSPQPAFLPAAWLSDLAIKYRAVVPDDKADRVTKRNFNSHGTKVFGYLAQHNPETEFVAIDTESFSPFIQHKNALCARDIGEFSSYMTSAASSLTADIIEANEVEFINYSGGFTQQDVYIAWEQNQCTGELSNEKAAEFLYALKPVYEALFNSPRALAFHAGNTDAVTSKDELDLMPFSNRVRVYQYSTSAKNTTIQPFGKSEWQQVYVEQPDSFVGNESIDLYINVGYDPYDSTAKNSTPKMEPDVLGMRYGVEQALYGSSWTTPIATSYAINEQVKLATETGVSTFDPQVLKTRLLPDSCNDSGGYQGNETLAKFIEQGQGMCRIQDPLRHRADELNRIGYLSR